MKILLLTLDTFSRTGGIQAFNRSFQLALLGIMHEKGTSLTHFSLYDKTVDADPRYIADGSTLFFKGFAGKKLLLFKELVQKGPQFDIVIFGHINLAPLVLLPIFRKRKTFLVAHGIEVWNSLSHLRRRGLTRIGHILAVSHFTAGILTHKHGIPGDRILYFPNCLDPFFEKAEITPVSEWNRYWRLPAGARYLLTVTRLSASEKAKGYDEVIGCLPALAEKYPDLYYLLAGRADETEKARIMALAENLGVSNRVILPGYVKEAWLPALYNLAAAFVLPSRKEGFGIVLMEAAWWGCPIIAYDSGGISEALLGGQLGTLISPDQPGDLCSMLLKALEGTNEKTAQIIKNRALISSHFSFTRFCNRLRETLA